MIFYLDSFLTPAQGVGGFYPLPPATVGNRTLDLALKLYSNSTTPSNTHYLWLRFFDANTNQTIQHVSFFLTVNDTLLRDTFHTHTGTIMLQIISIDTPFNGTVIADREPILHAWVPHSNDEPVIVYAPVFNNTNSMYHLKIKMDSIDYDSNLFDESTMPQFSFNLNMKEQNQTLTSQNVAVPEFPVAIPVLLMGLTSLIVFSKMKIRI